MRELFKLSHGLSQSANSFSFLRLLLLKFFLSESNKLRESVS